MMIPVQTTVRNRQVWSWPLVGLVVLAAACNPSAPDSSAPNASQPTQNRFIPTPRHECPESAAPVPTRTEAVGPDLTVRERYCCRLTESQCTGESLCSPLLAGSGCYEDGPCLKDLAYLGCKANSDALIQSAALGKKLCEASGGFWSSSGPLSNHQCQCGTVPDPSGGPPVVRMPAKTGCMTLGEACELGGGRWAPPKKIAKGIAHYIRRPDQCVRSKLGVTATWNPEATTWDGKKGVCEILMERPRCHLDGREVADAATILGLVPAPKAQ